MTVAVSLRMAASCFWRRPSGGCNWPTDLPLRSDARRVRHAIADIVRARIFAIACGYEDANDLDRLRTDPAFKLACGRLPDSGIDLCSQPTCSRLENLPDLKTVIRLGDVLVDLWLSSYAAPPAMVTGSTSTTRSMSFTAISSCRSSTPTMTSAASCRFMSMTPLPVARSP